MNCGNCGAELSWNYQERRWECKLCGLVLEQKRLDDY